MVQKNKRNEAIYARKQERLTLITVAHLPLVISIFFCLWSFSLPRVSCLNPLPWESHLVLSFYFTPVRHLGGTTCADVIEMIENFLDSGRIVGEWDEKARCGGRNIMSQNEVFKSILNLHLRAQPCSRESSLKCFTINITQKSQPAEIQPPWNQPKRKRLLSVLDLFRERREQFTQRSLILETRRWQTLYLKIGRAPWILNSTHLSLKLKTKLAAHQVLIIHLFLLAFHLCKQLLSRRILAGRNCIKSCHLLATQMPFYSIQKE